MLFEKPIRFFHDSSHSGSSADSYPNGSSIGYEDVKKERKATIVGVSHKGKKHTIAHKVIKIPPVIGPFYYAVEGAFLGCGCDKDKPDEVRLAKLNGKTPSGKDKFLAVDLAGKEVPKWVVIHRNHDTFLKFCSCIDNESAAIEKEESFAIANAMVNYTNSHYAKRKGNTLDLMVSKENNEWYGVNKNIYEKYLKKWKKMEGNSKYAIMAAINALLSGEDYSKGAMQWDGGDLVNDKWFNSNYKDPRSHRQIGIIDKTEKDAVIAKFNAYWKPIFEKHFVELVEKADIFDNYGMEATVCFGGTIFFKPYIKSTRPESQILSFAWKTIKF